MWIHTVEARKEREGGGGGGGVSGWPKEVVNEERIEEDFCHLGQGDILLIKMVALFIAH